MAYTSAAGNTIVDLNQVIEIINEQEELDLPNGAKGAIWKEDLINILKFRLHATNTTPARET